MEFLLLAHVVVNAACAIAGRALQWPSCRSSARSSCKGMNRGIQGRHIFESECEFVNIFLIRHAAVFSSSTGRGREDKKEP